MVSEKKILMAFVTQYMKTSWDGTAQSNSGFYEHLYLYSENLYGQYHETKLCHYKNECRINFSRIHPVKVLLQKNSVLICVVQFVNQMSYDTNATVLHFMLMIQTHWFALQDF